MQSFDARDTEALTHFKESRHAPLFVHTSYRINIASTTMARHPALRQELAAARELGFTHVVLHPGSSDDPTRGIDSIARTINWAIRVYPELTFVLENVAFGRPSWGGALVDLKLILEKIDRPEAVGFCIDTAHAHALGYDLTSYEGRQETMSELDATLGADRIALIHCNDTTVLRGARHDQHCRIGHGVLGAHELKDFVMDVRLQNVPIIIELPALSEDDERVDLNLVRSWCT